MMSEINTYSVERIKHNQRHIFAGFFNQYNIYLEETLSDHAPLVREEELLPDSEPVLFIVLTNHPQPIPVGFIQLCSMGSSTSVINTTIVDDLFVLPDYRKNGIALRLIQAAVKFAIDNRSAFISLETLQGDLIAQKLFESVGFKCQASESELNFYSIQFECN